MGAEQWGSPDLPNPISCRRHWTPEEVAADAAWRARPRIKSRFSPDDLGDRAFAPIERFPACWAWPIVPEVWELLHQHRVESEESIGAVAHVGLMYEAIGLFDRGRCAVCGREPDHRVEDHDHETGLVRGWLCRSCNTREGIYNGPGGVFGRYRSRHPYLILGIVVRYSGYGWTDGVSDRAVTSDGPAGNAMAGAFD